MESWWWHVTPTNLLLLGKRGVKEIKEGIASRSTQTQGAFVCVCRLNDWVRRKERMTQEGHGKPLAAQGLLSFSRRRLF